MNKDDDDFRVGEDLPLPGVFGDSGNRGRSPSERKYFNTPEATFQETSPSNRSFFVKSLSSTDGVIDIKRHEQRQRRLLSAKIFHFQENGKRSFKFCGDSIGRVGNKRVKTYRINENDENENDEPSTSRSVRRLVRNRYYHGWEPVLKESERTQRAVNKNEEKFVISRKRDVGSCS
ncbi:hypothetical protein CEXT_412601 [Caerostris extrusa]|uniref:Uncharacterized protein n=1 Tax=Caerostris extrusa TaxID=172846 RepID=A0AAV4NYL1_CAEEX|nr:hypothetical protein CEXT_412601 [Caerostris extrusa]